MKLINIKSRWMGYVLSVFTNTIRIVNPSFRSENPYIFKLDTSLTKKIFQLYRKAIKSKKRNFSFMNETFSLNHQQVKLANIVFKNTDRNNAMVGSFNTIIGSLKKEFCKKQKKFIEDLYIFIRFITFAHSPILRKKMSSKTNNDQKTVSFFFLSLAYKIFASYKWDNSFTLFSVIKSKETNQLSNYESLSQYIFRNYKSRISNVEPFSFHYLNRYIDELNGNASVLAKEVGFNTCFNYYNYANIIMELYLLVKSSLDLEHYRFGYCLGLGLIIKLELALKLNTKRSIKKYSILTDESYSQVSFVYNGVLKELYSIGLKHYKKMDLIHGIITESDNKIWLKDEPKMSKSAIIALIINYLFMIVWAIIILYPLALLAKLTFNATATASLNTGIFEFSWVNFEHLFTKTDYLIWTKNTLIVAFVTAFLVTLFCSLLAYSYSRFDFVGKKKSIGTIMIFQMIPAGLALVVFIIYGNSIIDFLDWEGSYLLVLIIIYSGGAIAGNTFLLKGYMDTISPSVFDAARIDGCSHMRVFWAIAIPLAKPMMAVIFLWSFIGPFFDFILPSILSGNNSENFTMAAGLNTLISDIRSPSYSPGAFAAGAMLVAAPFTILFLSLNKQIIQGLTAGAVK